MYENVRVSSDGRCEVSVDWRVEGVVNPSLWCRLSDGEVIGLFQEIDHFVFDDVSDGLFQSLFSEYVVDLVLYPCLLGHLDWHSYFFHELLESIYFFGAWILMPSEKGMLSYLSDQYLSDLLIGQYH